MKAADTIYERWDEPVKSCILAMRQLILGIDDNITETVKYGMPCFCYGKKHFCYLWADKHSGHPYLLVVEGKLLSHPELVQGDRKRMKIFTVDPNEDLPVDTIKDILEEALSLYR